MNAYEILGVKPTDTKNDIKQAYKKLANKYHPDKTGGDEEMFKKIKQAYEEVKAGTVNLSKSYKFKNADDIYRYYQSTPYNLQHKKQYSVTTNISITNAMNGGMQVLKIVIVAGQNPQYINIEIPPGVYTGESILYKNIFLNKIDVIVTFNIVNDLIWQQRGLDLYRTVDIPIWDLILGTNIKIDTVHKETVEINVPAMTHPNSRIKVSKKGAFSRQNYLHYGDMYVILNTTISTIPDKLLSLIKEIYTK